MILSLSEAVVVSVKMIETWLSTGQQQALKIQAKGRGNPKPWAQMTTSCNLFGDRDWDLRSDADVADPSSVVVPVNQSSGELKKAAVVSFAEAPGTLLGAVSTQGSRHEQNVPRTPDFQQRQLVQLAV